MTDKKGLDPNAYTVLAEGEEYKPYVAASESPAEFTIKVSVSVFCLSLFSVPPMHTWAYGPD